MVRLCLRIRLMEMGKVEMANDECGRTPRTPWTFSSTVNIDIVVVAPNCTNALPL